METIDRLRAELLDARKENYADDFNFECDKRRELQTELKKCCQERDEFEENYKELQEIMKRQGMRHRLEYSAKLEQENRGLKERIKFIKEHAKEMEIGLKWAAQQFLAEQWGSEEHCDGKHNHWKICGNHIKDCLCIWEQALILDDEAEKQK